MWPKGNESGPLEFCSSIHLAGCVGPWRRLRGWCMVVRKVQDAAHSRTLEPLEVRMELRTAIGSSQSQKAGSAGLPAATAMDVARTPLRLQGSVIPCCFSGNRSLRRKFAATDPLGARPVAQRKSTCGSWVQYSVDRVLGRTTEIAAPGIWHRGDWPYKGTHQQGQVWAEPDGFGGLLCWLRKCRHGSGWRYGFYPAIPNRLYGGSRRCYGLQTEEEINEVIEGLLFEATGISKHESTISQLVNAIRGEA